MANSEYELAVKIAGKIDSSLTSATGLTKKELKAIAKEAASSSTSFATQFTKAYDKITPGITKFEKVAKKALKGVATAAAAAGTAIAGIAAYSINVGSSFESQMSTVRAITGATGDDFQALRDKAKQLGADTKYTATEVGEAMQYMGMAGWKTDQILAGISTVMDLASASGEDLGTVSDIVTDDMTAFGISLKGITTEEAEKRVQHFSDVLAAAATNTNTDVYKMGETFKYAGAVAGALGYSIDDVAIATGLMANSGIKADTAGTSLRSLFTRMAKPTKESADAMDKLGLSLTDSDGNMKSFMEIMKDMRKGFSGMTADEKAYYAAELAGQRGMSGLLAIVNATQSDFDDATAAIENCAGATKKMAEIKLDNLQGDVDIFKSALEGLGIEIYDQAVSPMRDVVQGGTDVINMINQKLKETNWVKNFMTDVTENLPTVGRVISDTGKDLSVLFTPIKGFGAWCLKNPDTISSVLTGIVSAFAVLKGGQTVAKVVKAFTGLAGILTSPVAAGILAVAAAIGGAAGIASAIKKARKAMDQADLEKHFGTIKLSMEDLDEVATHILKDANFDGLDSLSKASEQLESYKDSVQETKQDLAKLQWKVDLGIELNEDEKSQYIQDVGDYISGVQDAVQQQQYTLDVSIGLLFDDNDPTGNLIKSETDSMFSDSESTLAALGKRLQSYVNKAFDDGLLTIDEQKHIKELQQQMANIEAAMTDANFEASMQGIALDYSGKDLDPETFQNLQSEINDKISEATEGYQEARDKTIASLVTLRNKGDITDEQYDSQVNDTQLQYLNKVGKIQVEGQNYMLSSIYDAYSDELAKAAPELQEQLNQVMTDYASGDMESVWASQADKGGLWDQMIKEIDISSLSQAAKDNLKALLEQMEPTTEQLIDLEQKYKALGGDIPQWIEESLEDTQNLKALYGDSDAMMYEIGENMANHPELQQQLTDTGNSIPDAVADGMKANTAVVKEAAKYTFDEGKKQLITQAEKPIDINLRYRVNSVGYDAKSDTTYYERYGKSVQVRGQTQPTDYEKYGYSYQTQQAAAPEVSTNTISESAQQLSDSVNSEITNSSELQTACQTAGSKVPEGVAKGITANTSEATNAARKVWSQTSSALKSLAASGISVDTIVNVNATGKLSYTSPTGGKTTTLPTENWLKENGYGTTTATKHAQGGIMTTPHVGIVAEQGPEAIIPLTKKARAVSLLQETADILGVSAAAKQPKKAGVDTATNISNQYSRYAQVSRTIEANRVQEDQTRTQSADSHDTVNQISRYAEMVRGGDARSEIRSAVANAQNLSIDHAGDISEEAVRQSSRAEEISRTEGDHIRTSAAYLSSMRSAEYGSQYIEANKVNSSVYEAKAGGDIYRFEASAHADGGAFETPHVGIVAEQGPEAIIPLTNTDRAREVLRETAGYIGAPEIAQIAAGQGDTYTSVGNGGDAYKSGDHNETRISKALSTINAEKIYNGGDTTQISKVLSEISTDGRVYRNAAGGIYNRQTLTTIAEQGPEAIIPFDGSARSLQLYQQAGDRISQANTQYQSWAEGAAPRSTAPAQYDITQAVAPIGVTVPETGTGTDLGSLLEDLRAPHPADSITQLVQTENGQQGQTTNNQGGDIKVEYKPTLNFYSQGTPSRSDIQSAERMSQQEFAQMMDRYLKNRSRYSF